MIIKHLEDVQPHNMAERQREEDSDNMLLAIECVNDWAERIVNRSWTQSQKQEQEEV
jgi:hypothetical protein